MHNVKTFTVQHSHSTRDLQIVFRVQYADNEDFFEAPRLPTRGGDRDRDQDPRDRLQSRDRKRSEVRASCIRESLAVGREPLAASRLPVAVSPSRWSLSMAVSCQPLVSPGSRRFIALVRCPLFVVR